MNQWFLLFLASLFSFASLAQDAMFYQKNSVLFHYNPALVGAKSDAAFGANHRRQWDNHFDVYNTNFQTNYNFKNNVGLGMAYQNEALHKSIYTNVLLLNGNYVKNFENGSLFAGANLSWISKRLDPKLVFDDQINPTTGFEKESVETIESSGHAIGVDIGTAINYKNFVVGFSVFQLNAPNKKPLLSDLNRRFVGSIAYSKLFTANLRLGGQAAYQKQTDIAHLSAIINGQYKFIKVGLGVGYPTSAKYQPPKFTYVSMAGVQFDKWGVAYNYDFFNYSGRSYQSHEISAAWFIKGLKKDSKTAEVLNALL